MYWFFYVWLFPYCVSATEVGRNPESDLTLWLIAIPVANASNSNLNWQNQDKEISLFNTEFGQEQTVTVLNTTQAWLKDQLISRNPESGEPDWQTIKAQRARIGDSSGICARNGDSLKCAIHVLGTGL